MDKNRRVVTTDNVYEIWNDAPSQSYIPVRRQPGERSRGPCMICARSSNGHHYSVQSCEGCKGFFRRSVLHKFKYECKTGNNDCDLINTSDRQRCQLCRLRTCFEHGMREAFVKKTLRKSRKSKAMVSWRRSVIVEPFTFEQRLLVNESLTIWLNAINPDARRRITNEVLPNSSAIGKGLAMFTVMTNAKAKLIAQNFSMMSHLHDFTASEQKIMLNKTMPELMILVSLEQYDKDNNEIIMMDGSRATLQMFVEVFNMPTSFAEDLFDFCIDFFANGFSRTMIAILASLILFSPDRGYAAHLDSKLNDLSNIYMKLMMAYLNRYHGYNPNSIAKLMNIILRLRRMNHNIWHGRELKLAYQAAEQVTKPPVKHEIVHKVELSMDLKDLAGFDMVYIKDLRLANLTPC